MGINNKCSQKEPIEEDDNNFIAIRTFPTKEHKETSDIMYAEFDTGSDGFITWQQPKFYEMYDMAKDPWQITNIYNNSESALRDKLHNQVHAWLQCKGSNCP